MQASLNSFNEAATAGLVDSVTSLSNDRAYLVSGMYDTFITSAVVQQTEAFYRAFIHNDYKIITNYSIPAGHGWITDQYGGPCWSSNMPLIVNCGFDLAGDMLKHLLGTLKPRTQQVSDNLKSFDQSHYGDVWQAGMSSRGWIYLPPNCVNNKGCQVIVMYHGCHQNYDSIGDTFVKETGINEWAESNDIVVIYPQAIGTAENPAACWDTWGYTGSNFTVQAGLQMKLAHGIALNPPYLNWSN
jgi:poly(3-hydroxybutyrate) depolymerase